MPKKVPQHTANSMQSAATHIIIKGARIHNLKNLDVSIPRNRLVVITGLSGSGKSSLAFDTLYAEGQRRYVESLSAYARQFLGKLNKPQVDYIRGISPAIAIEQKVISRNPRSTVGTSTEIYDYLKLMFARIGKTYSPVSGELVKRDTVQGITELLLEQPVGTQVHVLADLPPQRAVLRHLEILQQQGFSRIWIKGKIQRIDEVLELAEGDAEWAKALKQLKPGEVRLLVDRLVLEPELEETRNRLSDSVQIAFYEGGGTCWVEMGGKLRSFSNRFERDGMEFTEPSVHFFAFNNPVGACKRCEGFGSVIGIDENLVVPDPKRSIYEGAIACWRTEVMRQWYDDFILKAYKMKFPVHRPYKELSEEDREVLWKGKDKWVGIDGFFRHLEEQSYKIQYRVLLSRYRGKTVCPACRGTRLREDAAYVKVAGITIQELVLMPVDEALEWFRALKLSTTDAAIAKRLLVEITNRLGFLVNVGLGYLTLNRLSNSLSGGESQRINLATSLGSSLVGSLYVLDEPSIGLHPRDTERLIGVLQSLKALGNTVVVVEHDEEIMRQADQIIDIGPLAGSGGGKLVFQGTLDELEGCRDSLTARYLTGTETIPLPATRRPWKYSLKLAGVREHNLKDVTVEFPLGVLTVVTGVSGSGKTTLVKRVLHPALQRHFGGVGDLPAFSASLQGASERINAVELVDQNPIGKSSRSNPVTYIKAYDEIRALFADQPLAKQRGLKPNAFSFNVEGGRCEMCQGEGEVTVEMQFMADLHLPCEACGGRRFKSETLEVLYRDKSAADVLDMTVDDAIAFFDSNPKPGTFERKIVQRLKPLQDVGLGYVQLGQSSSTLSGGEAQRIKLASFLVKGNTEGSTLFLFDEPTTGLHFHDIRKLLQSFNALIELGHSILVIEHHPDVIKSADWVIDLGPEGGKNGGNVVYQGTPEGLAKCKESYTGKYLVGHLKAPAPSRARKV
jgi:excinuclease ABC subunit A